MSGIFPSTALAEPNIFIRSTFADSLNKKFIIRRDLPHLLKILMKKKINKKNVKVKIFLVTVPWIIEVWKKPFKSLECKLIALWIPIWHFLVSHCCQDKIIPRCWICSTYLIACADGLWESSAERSWKLSLATATDLNGRQVPHHILASC